ncbi:MAG: biotin/lipoyl-binding protein, partial [Candidatus Coatesbacteria bacterium]|nr:biotin/lipoyl-binding protein [Candidatus Coatesbacteria bacterium]
MRRREHFGKPLQAVLCLIVAVFITGCAGDKPNESAGGKGDDLLSKKAPVKVAVVSRGTVQSWISLTATLLPIRESRVGAKVGGRVAEILADEGDSVEQGAALFKLEQRDFELARDQAKHNLDAATAGLSAANVNLENTSREFERLKGLRASNAVSQQDYDSAADAVKA